MSSKEEATEDTADSLEETEDKECVSPATTPQMTSTNNTTPGKGMTSGELQYERLRQRFDQVNMELAAVRQQNAELLRDLGRAASEGDMSLRRNTALLQSNIQQLRKELQDSLTANQELSAEKLRLERQVQSFTLRQRGDGESDAGDVNSLSSITGSSPVPVTSRETFLNQGQPPTSVTSPMASEPQDSFGKVYGPAVLMERYSALKKQHKDLVLEYQEVISTNESAREVVLLRKQLNSQAKELQKSKEETASLKTQCTAAILKWNNHVREISQLKDQVSSKNEELKSLYLERRETQLQMSERDNVLKEVEQLQDKLTEANKVIQQLTEANQQSPLSTEDEFNDQVDHGVYENGTKSPSQEATMLRCQVEALQRDLTEAKEETSDAKQRREWAFHERNKIVLECDAIRKQCDKLRRERDRTVSEHAEVLRELDELKNKERAVQKELQELNESKQQEERKQHLVCSSNSRDSAIDLEMPEAECDILLVELDCQRFDDLGLQLRGGYLSSAVVSKITNGKASDGVLRVNDVLLEVNGVDVSRSSPEAAISTLQSATGRIMLKVRRKKYAQQLVTQTTISLNRQDSGIHFEQGYFISKIVTNSPTDKHRCLSVGDRILSVNNKNVEKNTKPNDVFKWLHSNSDELVIKVLRTGAPPTDGSGQVKGQTTTLANMAASNQSDNTSSNRGGKLHSSNKLIKLQNLIFKSSRHSDRHSDSRHTDLTDDSPTSHHQQSPSLSLSPDSSTSTGQVVGTWPRVFPGNYDSNTLTPGKGKGERKLIPMSLVSHEQVYTTPPAVSSDNNHTPTPSNVSEMSFSSCNSTASAVTMESRGVSDSTRHMMHSDAIYTTFPAHAATSTLPTSRGSYATGLPPGGSNSLPRPATANPEDMDNSVALLHKKYLGAKRKTFRPQGAMSVDRIPPSSPYHISPTSPFSFSNPSRPRSTYQIISNAHSIVTPFPSSSQRNPSIPELEWNSEMRYHPGYSVSPSPQSFNNSAMDGLDQNRPVVLRGSSNSSLTFSRKVERINFASKSSIHQTSTSSIDRGSSSDRSSPTSPVFESSAMSKSHTLPKKSRPKPKEGEIRTVVIKRSEPLGIQIEEHKALGIFISSVADHSQAYDAGVYVGDNLLEVCGVNLRKGTRLLASQVLQNTHTPYPIKLQYNPSKKRLDGMPSGAPDPSPQRVRSSETLTSSPRKSSRGPSKDSNSSQDSSIVASEQKRLVCLQRSLSPSSVRLIGGNLSGIFVDHVNPDSPAHAHLKTADRILEINGVDMTHNILEAAAIELQRPVTTEMIKINAQFSLIEYNKLKAKQAVGGDMFYVRAQCNHQSSQEKGLTFSSGDILLVENSLYSGKMGQWWATLVTEQGQRGASGVIPSRIRMEESSHNLQRSFSETLQEADEQRSSKRSLLGSRGGSFFKRKPKKATLHQRSSSHDSRELTSFSDLTAVSAGDMLADEGAPLVYQKIERVECTDPRPVLLIGPLAENMMQKLNAESSERYVPCPVESVRMKSVEMHHSMTEGVFVDSKRRGDAFEVIRAADIKKISSEKHHCLITANPNSVERMHRMKICPIVIFIKFKSFKQLKEVKDPNVLPVSLPTKVAKEMFDKFHTIEEESKNTFAVVVEGAPAMACTIQKIKQAIDSEQKKIVWLPTIN